MNRCTDTLQLYTVHSSRGDAHTHLQRVKRFLRAGGAGKLHKAKAHGQAAGGRLALLSGAHWRLRVTAKAESSI
jgi:hypothetical protein